MPPLAAATSTADSPAALLAVDVPEPPSDLTREWLLTDGRGGYASSTPSLCATRRYHGLLVSPFPGSAKRHLFLSRFDERLDGEPLGIARYGDEWAPRGDRALVEFTCAPHPRATYAIQGGRVSREVRMAPGRRAVLVRYELHADEGAADEGATDEPRGLELRPLLPFREADALTVENPHADPTLERLDGEAEGGVAWRLYEALPRLALTASAPIEVEESPAWYRGLSFQADEARGYSGGEDQLSPAVIRATLRPGEAIVLAATIEEPVVDPAALWKAAGEQEPRPKKGAPKDPVVKRLHRAADAFLYTSDDGRTAVTAGFPWFVEWGRDTFLALPGLTLARGRVKDCEKALLGALPYLKDGLLPNVFGASVEDSAYNSADAALWFARAVLLFDRAGGARRPLKNELIPALRSIAEAYLEGAEMGLRFDDQGILHAGSPELNPTWMDAQTSAGPVTPRHGAPVEIAALGYSLCAHLDEYVDGPWTDLVKPAKKAFLERYWVEDGGYLADVWRADTGADTAVRPNMVLAAALELSPLSKPKRAAVVARAREDLLTEKGLRTLAPQHADYIGAYAGGPEKRDGAYHQGTVWPWLMGFYTEASLRSVKKPTKKLTSELRALWDELAVELDRAGIDHLSEVFDGDAPREPGGTIAQAWNTAEWIRALDMLQKGLSG